MAVVVLAVIAVLGFVMVLTALRTLGERLQYRLEAHDHLVEAMRLKRQFLEEGDQAMVQKYLAEVRRRTGLNGRSEGAA